MLRQELARAGAAQVVEQVVAVPPGAGHPDLNDPGIDGFGRRVDGDAAGGVERGACDIFIAGHGAGEFLAGCTPAQLPGANPLQVEDS